MPRGHPWVGRGPTQPDSGLSTLACLPERPKPGSLWWQCELCGYRVLRNAKGTTGSAQTAQRQRHLRQEHGIAD
eukprot:107659-Alexandrium_andersonii.AAC.1